MAERRMFSKTVVDSDTFLDMPPTTQNLYFHLSMRADDDGFVNNPKKIQRMVGANEDDLKLLLAKGYIIAFESGIIVIKHWRLHNYIRKDRYKETAYIDEMRLLHATESGEYELKNDAWLPDGIPSDIPTVYQMETQVRLGKVSIGKDNILCAPDEPARNQKPLKEEKTGSIKPKNSKHKYGEYENVLLSDGELDKLKHRFPDYLERIERLSGYIASKGTRYKSHYATICNWAKNEKPGGRVKINPAMTDLDHLF
ncbi:hypothetical protein IMSAG013_01389 [Clostridiales bacterium]|nr:hypothetical protein IMSAG013_01389 [Clostridiales bacterium]